MVSLKQKQFLLLYVDIHIISSKFNRFCKKTNKIINFFPKIMPTSPTFSEFLNLDSNNP